MSQKKEGIRLHLGCGEHYLNGYVNVDLPAKEHTVMAVRPDIVKDFRTLTYSPGSVDEIRSHHLFEHFTRSEALRILLEWRRWLVVGGTLHIETPDFDTAAWYYLLSGRKARAELRRHIFGSQEAAWANHYDGWGKQKYQQVLGKLGFTALRFEKRSNSLSAKYNSALFNWVGVLIPNALYRRLGWNKLPNITVIARKDERAIDEQAVARDLLRESLVGKENELLLSVWLDEVFKKQ